MQELLLADSNDKPLRLGSLFDIWLQGGSAVINPPNAVSRHDVPCPSERKIVQAALLPSRASQRSRTGSKAECWENGSADGPLEASGTGKHACAR